MNLFRDGNADKFLTVDANSEGDICFAAADEHAQRIVSVWLSRSQAVKVRALLAEVLKDFPVGSDHESR